MAIRGKCSCSALPGSAWAMGLAPPSGLTGVEPEREVEVCQARFGELRVVRLKREGELSSPSSGVQPQRLRLCARNRLGSRLLEAWVELQTLPEGLLSGLMICKRQQQQQARAA